VRRVFFSLSAVLILLSPLAIAGHNPADYPLRVHIFSHNAHSHYTGPGRVLEFADGEGTANLYENGEPRGFEYSYRCDNRLANSPGFETFPARWKKKDQSLELLLPVMGKPGEGWTCVLKVGMKDDMAFYRHNGGLDIEPSSVFKQWMEKHEYDPEHGKSQPVFNNPQEAAAPKPTATAGTSDSK